MIKTEIYDSVRNIKRYILTNPEGYTAAFLERGATITTLTAPDRNGLFENVVLELKDYDEYLKNESFIGVVPGRYANRIANAKFTLNGKTYQLAANDNGNCLHGGKEGFDKKNWTVVETVDTDHPSITFEYISPDGEENFPGQLTAQVKYTLEADGLRIDYKATTTEDTIVNLTQHSYFNLSGNYKDRDIHHTIIYINADKFTEVDQNNIPTGNHNSVKNGYLDFSKPSRLYAISNYKIDHNFEINNPGTMRINASAYDEKTGRMLTVESDYPGMQFYAGFFLDATLTHKNGQKITRQSAFCMETQMYPDSPNHADFPSTILKKGETYKHTAKFKFSTK